jgi:ribonuclease J
MAPTIIIHRGTHQIGGCVTEIKTEHNRIIIDFGSNLPGIDISKCKSDEDTLQDAFGLEHCDGVLFSHYHGDHIGMYKNIPKGIPLYIGSTAKKILKVITEKLDCFSNEKGLPIIEDMVEYKIGQWMYFGEIRVKPLVVDHSALDSYMFLIEVNGKRILFTGDFREHGITGENNRLEKMIHNYVGDEVDILITEGTMLSRIDDAKPNQVMTEEDLGNKAREIFSKTENKHNFVLVSSTNLDSIMEFYHAVPYYKAFVCDEYQARLMQIAMEDKGKYYKKYRPSYIGSIRRPIYIMGKLNGLSNVDGYFKADFNKMREKGFVMLVRANKNPKSEQGRFKKVINYFAEDNPLIIYSMWEGYLKGKHKDENIVNFIGNYRMEHLHTSGHAYVETIKKLIELTNPKIIIPMHTECADVFANIQEFKEYANRVKVLEDGEIFELTK